MLGFGFVELAARKAVSQSTERWVRERWMYLRPLFGMVNRESAKHLPDTYPVSSCFYGILDEADRLLREDDRVRVLWARDDMEMVHVEHTYK